MKMAIQHRVVITGLGVVSPIGCLVDCFWKRLLAGESGIVALKDDDYATLPSKIAGVVNDNDLHISNNELSKLSRSAAFSLDASEQALVDANLFPKKMTDTSNIGVLFGVGMVDLADVCKQYEQFSKRGYSKVSPWFIPKILPNHPAGVVALRNNINGLVHCVSTACATGAHAIGDAFRLIKMGELDAVLVGAVDTSVNPLSIAGFSRMRALSIESNDAPHSSSKPFDTGRNGFVISEGSAALLLESERHALSRNVKKIYAELIGYGYSSDAHHISAPPNDGRGAKAAIMKALSSAGITSQDIGYINAHATSTPLGDAAEVNAICGIFSSHVPWVSSTKGALGHLLGAAGAIESLATVLAIHSNTIPGTTNLKNIDSVFIPKISEKLIPHGQVRAFGSNNSSNRRVAIKNSFGFYGANASLCFAEYK